MPTFALVAYTLLGGTLTTFVLDTGMSVDDCRAALAHGVAAVVLDDGTRLDLGAASEVVCVLED